jgi:hypothetical protein
MTEQNQNKDDEIGFFAGSLISIITLIVIVALIVGLVTITRTWERTDLSFQHKEGNFSVIKKSWWGLLKKATAYTHRSNGWNTIDEDGYLRPLIDTDETKIDIKDASNLSAPKDPK